MSVVLQAPRWNPGRVTVGATVAVGTLVGVGSTSPTFARIAIGLVVAAGLAALAAARPAAGLLAFVVWSVLLGLTRRILSDRGFPYGVGDPVLLVGPVVMVTLGLVACSRGALRARTPLTYAVLALGAALALSAFNPLQGGLSVGAAGAGLVVVPMVAFLVGRSLVSDRLMTRVFGAYAVLSVGVACYGLYQTFVGLPAWDARWVENAGYNALNVNGVVRPFGPSTSAAEYIKVIGIGVVCWLVLGVGSRWRTFVIPSLGVLTAALWLASGRKGIVFLVLSLAVVAAARARLPMWASALVALAAIAAIPLATGRLAPDEFGSDPQGRLAAHQAAGLGDPFGDESTMTLHLELIGNGVASVRDAPLGYGVGSVTIAKDRFGGSGAQAEADIGDAALAAGLVGLLAFSAALVLGGVAAHRTVRFERSPVALAALGCLLVTILAWMNGGLYGVAPLPWLILGWLDRPPRERQRAAWGR